MMIALLVGLVLALVLWLIELSNYLQAEHRLVRLPPRAWDANAGGPLVSIVMPARNEAHQIRACLDSLMAQDYPNWELIVVDDRSEDGTMAILQEAASRDVRVTVVEGAPLPEGWMGKSWAVHQGVGRARGEWLLFTDADTWHHPHALSSAMRYMAVATGDALTLLPETVCLTFWERVIQPAVIFSIAGTFSLDRLQDPDRPEAIFNGQYILLRRDIYERSGGHEAIRSSVVDDLSLAGRVKAAGGVIRYPIGAQLMKVRMYTTFAEIWKGWSKNLFAGAKGNVALGVAGVLLMPIMHVLPWVALPYLAWTTAASGGWLPTLGVIVAGLVVALTLWARGKGLQEYTTLSPLWALAHPLAFVVVWLIFINSMWRGVSGKGPEWKGRTYPGLHT